MLIIAACHAKPTQMYTLLHAIQFLNDMKCNNILLVGTGGGGSSWSMVLAGNVFRGTMSKFGTLSPLRVMRRLPG